MLSWKLQFFSRWQCPSGVPLFLLKNITPMSYFTRKSSLFYQPTQLWRYLMASFKPPIEQKLNWAMPLKSSCYRLNKNFQRMFFVQSWTKCCRLKSLNGFEVTSRIEQLSLRFRSETFSAAFPQFVGREISPYLQKLSGIIIIFSLYDFQFIWKFSTGAPHNSLPPVFIMGHFNFLHASSGSPYKIVRSGWD